MIKISKILFAALLTQSLSVHPDETMIRIIGQSIFKVVNQDHTDIMRQGAVPEKYIANQMRGIIQFCETIVNSEEKIDYTRSFRECYAETLTTKSPSKAQEEFLEQIVLNLIQRITKRRENVGRVSLANEIIGQVQQINTIRFNSLLHEIACEIPKETDATFNKYKDICDKLCDPGSGLEPEEALWCYLEDCEKQSLPVAQSQSSSSSQKDNILVIQEKFYNAVRSKGFDIPKPGCPGYDSFRKLSTEFICGDIELPVAVSRYMQAHERDVFDLEKKFHNTIIKHSLPIPDPESQNYSDFCRVRDEFIFGNTDLASAVQSWDSFIKSLQNQQSSEEIGIDHNQIEEFYKLVLNEYGQEALQAFKDEPEYQEKHKQLVKIIGTNTVSASEGLCLLPREIKEMRIHREQDAMMQEDIKHVQEDVTEPATEESIKDREFAQNVETSDVIIVDPVADDDWNVI